MKTPIRSLVVTFIFLCITPPFLHAEDIVSQIAVGRRPTDITFAPNGNRAYVNNFDDGTVSVIDPRSDQVVATIPVGEGPTRPIAATNERVFVPNAGRGDDEHGTVSVIDATGNRVIKEIPVGVDPSSVAATFVRCEVQPGLSYTHTRINFNATKTLESSSFLYALVELLNEKGLLSIEKLDEREKQVAGRLVRKFKESGIGLE